MSQRSLGALLIVAGLVAALLGVAVASGALSWFGRLPGDIRIRGENTRVFIPLTSMLVVSVVLSLVLNLVRRFL